MFKWLLAIASWGFLSNCGPDENQEGSQRYRPVQHKKTTDSDESSTGTSREQLPRSSKGSTAEPTEPRPLPLERDIPQPKDADQPALPAPGQQYPEVAKQIPTQLTEVSWKFSTTNSGRTALVRSISTDTVTLVISPDTGRPFTSYRLGSVAGESSSQVNYFAESAGHITTTTVSLWINPQTSECQIDYRDDSYWDVEDILHGHCDLP